MLKKIIFRVLFDSIYLAGLLSLFGFITTLSFRTSMKIAPDYFLVGAVFLIFLAFIGETINEKNFGMMLKRFGLITLIPGIVGFFAVFFGKKIFYDALMRTSLDIGFVNMLMNNYVKNVIPRTYALIVFYILVGVVMYTIGKKKPRSF